MKTKLLLLVTIAFAVCAAFVFINEDLHQAMTKMMEKMKSMKMTGNPDHDFAMMMAEHHQGSIDAAEIVSKSGKDQKIKSLAQSILDKQPGEQKQLRAHKGPGNDHSAHAANEKADKSGFISEIKQVMNEMESRMRDMKMTNNLDHDFATMMIPHHESANDMADAVIKHGKDQEIKSIAEKIKADSQKEIGELKDWLSQHK